MKIRARFLGILGILLIAAPAFAAPVDGKWSGMIDTPMGPVTVAFTFKADGAALAAGRPERTLGGDVDGVGAARIDQDAGDVLALVEAGLDALRRDGVQEAMVNVIFPRPLHLYRRTDRL